MFTNNIIHNNLQVPSLTMFSSKLFLVHPTNYARSKFCDLTNISTKVFDIFIMLLASMQGHPKLTLLAINLPLCPSIPISDEVTKTPKKIQIRGFTMWLFKPISDPKSNHNTQLIY